MRTLGSLGLNVLLQLRINNLAQEMILLRLLIVGFGKQMSMMMFILIIS